MLPVLEDAAESSTHPDLFAQLWLHHAVCLYPWDDVQLCELVLEPALNLGILLDHVGNINACLLVNLHKQQITMR